MAASPPSERSATLPRSERLLRRSQFVRVQQGGRRVNTAHFVVLVLSQAGSPLRAEELAPGRRLGLTVGKRVGNAVRRNRIKRVLREVYRRNKALFPADCDVVIVARPGAERLDYRAVKAEMERARDALARVSTRPK